MILIDTGPIVALLRRPDQHHERCVAALRSLREPLATVWPVVSEAMFLLVWSCPNPVIDCTVEMLAGLSTSR